MGNQHSGKRCQCLSPNRHRSHPQELHNLSHLSQVTSWIPPRDNWYPKNGLPYGWEEALDKNDKPYYINHIERYTTRSDPREDVDYIEPPQPRDVTLSRDPHKGFGFVAGSEKPVVVRFVTEGGPSMSKLLPGDQIIKINGEDVKKSPRDYVIDLVRSSEHTINLTVCQPYMENAGRRSAFLTPAKKARLRSNPTRVRFADSVTVNGTSVISPSCQESYVPLMPNVLKVFLENGQTKSFKYDKKTTVKDVINSLHEKLNIKSIHHFALVLFNMRSPIPGKLSILRENETMAEVAARPGSRHFRCLFRICFVPIDAYRLLKEDPPAFEYYFTQCCNDVVQERFAGDLKYESMFRLAALHIQQHITSRGTQSKFSLKSFEKEFGLNRFVPRTILENMKMKDVRRTLTHYLRQNQSLSVPGQKNLTSIQARLHYIKILSDLMTFGGRIFLATIMDGGHKCEHMIVVGPRTGISRITNVKTYHLQLIAEFDQIEELSTSRDGDNIQWVTVSIKPTGGDSLQALRVGLLNEDVPDFIALLEGYYRAFVDNTKVLVDQSQLQKEEEDIAAPAYDGKHRVIPNHWSYPDNMLSQPVEMDTGQSMGKVQGTDCILDLSQCAPAYDDDEEELMSNFSDETRYVTSHHIQPTHQPTNGTIESSLHSPDLPALNTVTNSKCNGQAAAINNGISDLQKEFSDDTISSEKKLDTTEEDEADDDLNDSFTYNDFDYNKLVSSNEDPNLDTSNEMLSVENYNQQLSSSPVGGSEHQLFRRYVPSPLSSHARRLRQRKLGTSSVLPYASEEEVLEVVKMNDGQQNSLKNGNEEEEGVLSDTDSTGSGCGGGRGGDSEKKPLLSVRDSIIIAQTRHDLHKDSDSDSWDTSLSNQQGPKPQSFKLRQETSCSLPKTRDNNSNHLLLQGIHNSFGLHSPDQLQPMSHGKCSKDCKTCLFLDSDITDLTLIPPPEVTANLDGMSATHNLTSAPPPGFSDEDEIENNARFKNLCPKKQQLQTRPQSSKLVHPVSLVLDQASIKVMSSPSSDIYNVTAEIHSPSSPSHTRNNPSEPIKIKSKQQRLTNQGVELRREATSAFKTLSSSIDTPASRRCKLRTKRFQQMVRSASAEHCPSLLDDDIDSLIAKLIVPPPPSVEEDICSEVQTSAQTRTPSWSGWSGDGSYSDTSQGGHDSGNLSVEEDISLLVIPPPPLSSSSSSSESCHKLEKPQPSSSTVITPSPVLNRFRKSSSYMKANSIDLLFEEVEDDQSMLQLGSKESLECQSLVTLLSDDDGKNDSKGSYRDNIQSPTSVSEKLKTLLHLIPPSSVQQSQILTKSSTLPDSGVTSSKTNSPMMQSYSESASLHSLQRNSSSDVESLQDTVPEDNIEYLNPDKENNSNETSQNGKQGTYFTCDNKSIDHFIPKHIKVPHSSVTAEPSSSSEAVALRNGNCDDIMDIKTNSQCDNKAFHGSKIQTLFRDLSLKVSQPPFYSDILPANYLSRSRSLDFAQAPDDIQCTQVCSSSETFTALKTKLQAYRDLLLKRKSRSSADKSNLHRSHSLTHFTQDSNSCWKRTSSLENKHVKTVEKGNSASIYSSENVGQYKNQPEIPHKQSLMMQGISSRSNTVLRPRTALNKLPLPHHCSSFRRGPLKAVQYAQGPSSKPSSSIETNSASITSSTKSEANCKHFSANPICSTHMWQPVVCSGQTTEDSSAISHYATFKHIWDSFRIQNFDSDVPFQTGSAFSSLDNIPDNKFSQSNSVLLSRVYSGKDSLTLASNDIETLVKDLNIDLNDLKQLQSIKGKEYFVESQRKLLLQTKQFINHTKLFLINAALTKEKLQNSLSTCMHSVTKVFFFAYETIIASNSEQKSHYLGTELCNVAQTFKYTLQAVFNATGKSNTDPHVQLLMRQALSLATLLRTFVGTIKSFEYL
ncbi:uncharacterized protein LOC106876727 isoform X2 [Argonauta hians]